MDAMTVLVSGAFGNVGSHVVEHLVAAGHRVTALDVRTPSSERRQAELATRRSFATSWTDLTDREAVHAVVREVRPAAIVHVAAIIAPIAYLVPERAQAVNVDGTRNLLEAATSLAARPRFVFTSSYSIHGPRNPHRRLPPITGATPVDPRDTYGHHKVAGERLLRESGLDGVVVRLPAVWSIDPTWGRDPAFLRFAFLLPPDRNEHAIDARDAALALANAATRDVGGATFIVGGGEGWSGSFSALMARLLRARGVPPIPDEAYRRADPLVDDAWYYEDLCDPSASQAALDYQRHGVEDHLAAIRPPAMTRLALRLGGPLVRRGMVKDSPYLGRPQAPDGAEIWTRVCETFGLDPAWRDRALT